MFEMCQRMKPYPHQEKSIKEVLDYLEDIHWLTKK